MITRKKMFKKHWKKTAVGIVAFTVLIGFGRPTYRGWRVQQAGARAVDYLAKTNYAAASLSARQALRLNSNSIPACQVMAELAERNRSPRALEWRDRIQQLDPGNPSNLLALARTAMGLGQGARAKVALAGIPAVAKAFAETNASYHAVAAQLAFAERNVATAERHLTDAVRLDPNAVDHRYNLDIVRLHSANPDVVRTARERLESSGADPLHGASILRALADEALARADLDRAHAISWQLQQRADAGFGDRMLHLVILARQLNGRPDEDRPFWTALATTQAAAMASPENTGGLLQWLAEQGMADAGLDWLNSLPETLRRDTQVRRGEMACYIAVKKWPELRDLLQLSHWGEDEHLRHAFLALAWRQDGDDAMARIEWKRAVRAGFPGSAAVLVRLAGTWKWEKEAEELLWEMSQEGLHRSWALTLLCRAYEVSGNTRSLVRVYDNKVTSNPLDEVARNNLAAACLLVRTNLGTAHRLAHEVYTAQPTNASFACTYAYSLHVQGRTSEALQILGGLPEEATHAPGLAAYYGLLLRAQGATETADKYLALAWANADRLLPEERELVKSALHR